MDSRSVVAFLCLTFVQLTEHQQLSLEKPKFIFYFLEKILISTILSMFHQQLVAAVLISVACAICHNDETVSPNILFLMR